jgi:hypothetical protein
VPADVAAIIHPSEKETLRVRELRQLAWQSTASPRLTILARPRSRGSRRTASLRAPSSRPAPRTSKLGSNTPESFQSSSQPSPRRPLQLATMPTRARRTGGGLGDSLASPTANPSTVRRMVSSLSFGSRVTAASNIRWPKSSRRKSQRSLKSESRSEKRDAYPRSGR